MSRLVTLVLVFFALFNQVAALPVIFGYPTNSLENGGKKSNEMESSNENGLFVASVNHALKRPITLNNQNTEKDNAITYNENIDFNNYVPIEMNAQPCDEVMAADRDYHPSYRRLVTRTIKEPITTYSNYYARPRKQLRDDEEQLTTSIVPLSTTVTTTTTQKIEVEECFRNSKLLPRSTIRKMNKRRRKLAQAIRRLNKLQRTYCLGLSRRSSDAMNGKCSEWREEKMTLYVKMLRLTHCTRGRARNA
ncbi:hypothetical protein M3Y98_00060000 [Aphelenchoides besseyi]|nr:hypothetical protein M3Y98_00060000 [Aphelenchoides besseyi]